MVIKSVLASLALLLLLPTLPAQANMRSRITEATEILENKQGSTSFIPPELIAHAQGVAIFTVTKAGLGLGGMGGQGIIVVRNPGGGWHAPIAFNMSGASLGAQIGFAKIRYILLLNTDDAIRLFTSSGKVAWDATATGTAGADTDIEHESTADLQHRAVIIFRESAGIFGGATFGGSTIEVKEDVNQGAYGSQIYVRDILSGRVPPPEVAKRLYQLLDGNR
jgi:lipid-binding SYLF domain-containing protein